MMVRPDTMFQPLKFISETVQEPSPLTDYEAGWRGLFADRAVTVDDYEFLAREATNDVRVTRCLAPRLQATPASA